jgi:flagellar protein FliL
MDQKEDNKMENESENVEAPKKGGFNMKVLLFGIPLFIIQLVAVYFVTANFLLDRMHANGGTEQVAASGEAKPADNKKENKPAELGKFIYMAEDLVINPANTDGKRFLLSTLGFDVASDENMKEMKEKDVLLKDAVNSVMSSKNFTQLANMAFRDTLRTEITKRLGQLMPKVKINTIYFSKYILQ